MADVFCACALPKEHIPAPYSPGGSLQFISDCVEFQQMLHSAHNKRVVCLLCFGNLERVKLTVLFFS